MRAAALVGWIVVAGVAGCQRSSGSGNAAGDCRETGARVDEALLAFLSKARSAHLEADLAEASGRSEDAIAVLDALVSGPAAGGAPPGPEVREVLADSLARLAELDAQRGRLEEARKRVSRGLALAEEPTHFRGRLFEVLGAVEKRAFDRLREQGDEPGALAAKERASVALREAIRIQEAVIERATKGPAER